MAKGFHCNEVKGLEYYLAPYILPLVNSYCLVFSTLFYECMRSFFATTENGDIIAVNHYHFVPLNKLKMVFVATEVYITRKPGILAATNHGA